MKTIPVTIYTLNPPGKPPTEVGTADLIRSLVSASYAEQGLDLEAQRKRIRILDACAKADSGAISLEDADYAELARLIPGMRWAWLDPVFVRFCDDIIALEK